LDMMQGQKVRCSIHQKSGNKSFDSDLTLASFHEKQIDLATCLLGGLPQSDRRNPSRKILEDRLGKAIRENEAQELSHGVNDVSTTMIYTHVLNRGAEAFKVQRTGYSRFKNAMSLRG